MCPEMAQNGLSSGVHPNGWTDGFPTIGPSAGRAPPQTEPGCDSQGLSAAAWHCKRLDFEEMGARVYELFELKLDDGAQMKDPDSKITKILFVQLYKSAGRRDYIKRYR